MSTWLVVEDEPDIYDVLVAMFQIWGIEGIAFVDGADAVQWIEGVDAGRVPGELPELAIIDLRLPAVPGEQVGARLRQSPKLNNIGIVLITAYRLTPEQERQVIATAQADLFLNKPLPNMPELRKMLDEVIRKRAERVKEKPESERQPVKPPATPQVSESKPSKPVPPAVPRTPKQDAGSAPA